MRCPKCGAEMQPGFLQADSETDILWVEKAGISL